ncbi:MAG: HEAT repeat domain-containing protein [Neobacillus sp.]|jgi:cbb3-type cytochrome oxidase subunit 3
MIEITLVALFILFLAMLFIQMSLFLYLAVKKHFNNKTKQRILQLKEEIRLDMFHYLQSGNGELLEHKAEGEKLQAVIELLSEFSNVLDDPDVKDRINLLAKEHLTHYLKRELNKQRWSLRINALYLVEDFYMDHLVPTLHRVYQNRRTTITEKTQIIKLLAKFNDPRTLQYLKDIHQSLSEFSLLSILLTIEEDTLNQFLEDFDGYPKKIQYMLIETIGKNQMINQHNLLQKLLKEEDEELRIRALKAYANSGVPIDTKLIAPFFDSENWQIRMMAAKVTGVQRLEQYRDRLISQLSDREYVVRAESAKAILRFKDGESTLKRVIEETTDSFAKDMAIEWLEKGRGHYSY